MKKKQTFEIYLSDLTEDAIKRYLAFHEISDVDELNMDLDTIPLCIIERGDEEL